MEEEEGMAILDGVGAVVCPVAICRWKLMFSDGHGGEQEPRKPPIKMVVMVEIMFHCCVACYMFVSQISRTFFSLSCYPLVTALPKSLGLV